MSARIQSMVAASVFLVLGAMALVVAVTQAVAAGTYRGSQPLSAEVVEVAGLERAIGPTVQVRLLGSDQQIQLVDATASEYVVGQRLIVYGSTSSSAPTFTDGSGWARYRDVALAGGGSLVCILCGVWHLRRARTGGPGQ